MKKIIKEHFEFFFLHIGNDWKIFNEMFLSNGATILRGRGRKFLISTSFGPIGLVNLKRHNTPTHFIKIMLVETFLYINFLQKYFFQKRKPFFDSKQ